MKELPTVGPEAETGRPGDSGDGGGAGGERPPISSGRLISTLAVAGVLAGLAIVVVFAWADPRIQAHRAEVLRLAVQEVLHGPARYESLYVTAEGLAEAPPPGTDTARAEKVFRGFDAQGRLVGYAITGSEPGFQDFIFLIFGYDPDRGTVLGMKVLESKETPGLGEKIVKDSAFRAGFEGAVAPLVGVKAGRATGDEHEVDMITGATISSRTVIGIVNHRLAALEPLWEGVPPPEPVVRPAAEPPPAAAADTSGEESGP